MGDEKVTATDLRKIATSASNQTVAGYVCRVREFCLRAAKAGQTSASEDHKIPFHLRDIVKQHLEADGFVVSYYDGDQRDPGQSITVSW